jgi:hypothetical protein
MPKMWFKCCINRKLGIFFKKKKKLSENYLKKKIQINIIIKKWIFLFFLKKKTNKCIRKENNFKF